MGGEERRGVEREREREGEREKGRELAASVLAPSTCFE